MSVRLIFRCQFCDAQPDPLTQISLEKSVPEMIWGAYEDAMPDNWLIWHGRGLYGPPRYACAAHRGDLVALSCASTTGRSAGIPGSARPTRATCATPIATGRSPSADARRCRSGATARRSNEARADERQLERVLALRLVGALERVATR